MARPTAAPTVVQMPTPRRRRTRKPLTEVQRNTRTVFNAQSKLSAQEHSQRVAEKKVSGKQERKTVTHKAETKAANETYLTGVRERSRMRVQSQGTWERAQARVATEDYLLPRRTAERIAYQKAAEKERTRGYLIRHTGSRAITSAANAAAPTANPILLTIFISFGLILVYFFVTSASGSNNFFNSLLAVVRTLSNSETPLFTREPPNE